MVKALELKEEEIKFSKLSGTALSYSVRKNTHTP